MATFEPFSSLGQAYEMAANTIVNSSISHLISVLSPVILTGITLYIIITGYMVVAGRIQDPISDILIKMTKWVIISWLALNASTITSYLITGVNGLEQTILQGFSLDGDTGDVYKTLDENLQKALLIAAESQNKSVLFDGFGEVFRGNIIAVVILISALLQTVLAGVIIILAKVSLLLIFALSPLMLAGLFFPQTAKFADAWFNQALNYVFVSVIVIFFQSIAIQIFKSQIASLNSDTATLVIIGKIALLSVANFFVIKQAPDIAAGLAGGVSSGTASLMGAARTMAGVGTGIGLAGGAARTFAHRSWSAAKTGGKSRRNVR